MNSKEETHLYGVQGSASATNTLHSSDSHASHTAQWSQTGIDCHVFHCILLLVVAGYHHCTCPTPSFPTSQLTASQMY